MDPMLAGLIAQALTFATVVAGIGVTYMTRRWSAQDRRTAALEVEKARLEHAAMLSAQLDARAAEIKADLNAQSELLVTRQRQMGHRLADVAQSLDANTELTRSGIQEVKAFADVANNVNEKIRSLGIEARHMQMGQDTNERVRSIQEDIHESSSS